MKLPIKFYQFISNIDYFSEIHKYHKHENNEDMIIDYMISNLAFLLTPSNFHRRFGHRIKIIRDKDKRCKMHRKFYSALSTGLIVKGKIIKTVDDLVLFDVVSSYNPADVVEMAEAIREFNKYNNNDKFEVNFDW